MVPGLVEGLHFVFGKVDFGKFALKFSDSHLERLPRKTFTILAALIRDAKLNTSVRLKVNHLWIYAVEISCAIAYVFSYIVNIRS